MCEAVAGRPGLAARSRTQGLERGQMELILLERRSELCFIIGQGIKNFGGCLRIQLSSHVLHTAHQPRGVTVKLKVTPLAPGTGLNRHIASTVLV